MRTEDLLITLDICRKCLPLEAHPVHYDRLKVIEDILITVERMTKNAAK